MLHKSGIVDLTQVVEKEELIDYTKAQFLQDSKYTHLNVLINDRIKVHYDTHDSWEIDQEALDGTDYYFKRSFSPEKLERLGEQRRKIHPLGLYYWLYPSGVDRFAIQRNFILCEGKLQKIYHTIRPLIFSDLLRFTPRVNNMWSPPDYSLTPKILFMVRAWETDDDPKRSSEKVAEIESINETRANCIKRLKVKFGSKFHGGFIHTDFAVKNYTKLLMSDNRLSSKGRYVNLLKYYPICVATTGLHGSIGGKFAEYIAFSKAILSEKLNYEVTGNLNKDRNYLEFNNSEELVENASRLINDKELRKRIMLNNAKYYQSYLRPDHLVLNTIKKCLNPGPNL
jgi:hypothetical protein